MGKIVKIRNELTKKSRFWSINPMWESNIRFTSNLWVSQIFIFHPGIETHFAYGKYRRISLSMVKKKPIMIRRFRIVCRILAPSRQRKFMEWFCSMVRRVYTRYNISALISAIAMYFHRTFAKNEIRWNDCFWKH